MISLKLNLVVLKKTDCFVVGSKDWEQLATKAIQGAALPLESVDDVHGGDSLPLGVLSVGDSISDDVLQEDLENSTSLLIDESRDPLDSSTASQSPDGGLGDALDVVPQHLAMTLGSSLPESLSSFATSTHVDGVSANDGKVRILGNI